MVTHLRPKEMVELGFELSSLTACCVFQTLLSTIYTWVLLMDRKHRFSTLKKWLLRVSGKAEDRHALQDVSLDRLTCESKKYTVVFTSSTVGNNLNVSRSK